MIKVLLAGDRPIVIQGIKQILTDTADIVPVLEARTADEMLEKVRTHTQVDLVVLSVIDKGPDVMVTLDCIHRNRPELAVVIVSDHEMDPALWPRRFTWVTTNSTPEDLVVEIRNAVHHAMPSEAEAVSPREWGSEWTAPVAGLTTERRQLHEEA
jgi:DNA-binding NarL/FixJ family response regulator